jgi:hypothetical protein
MKRFPVALALMLAPLLGAAGPAAAAQGKVVRVSGEVTSANYRALAALLMDSYGKVVGLKLSFKANDGYVDGKLSAYEDGGLFVAYVPGPDNDSQISAASGYTSTGGAYVFDGFYDVVDGGMAQGIMAISLEKTNKPSGAIDDVDVDSLEEPGN